MSGRIIVNQIQIESGHIHCRSKVLRQLLYSFQNWTDADNSRPIWWSIVWIDISYNEETQLMLMWTVLLRIGRLLNGNVDRDRSKGKKERWCAKRFEVVEIIERYLAWQWSKLINDGVTPFRARFDVSVSICRSVSRRLRDFRVPRFSSGREKEIRDSEKEEEKHTYGIAVVTISRRNCRPFSARDLATLVLRKCYEHAERR